MLRRRLDKIMRKIVQHLLFLLLLGCSNVKPGTNTISINPIVLVNIDGLDRISIANLLIKLEKCKPKVVGINAIFDGTHSESTDSLLSNAMKSLANVVLISLRNDDKLVQSAPVFIKSANREGVLTHGNLIDGSLIYKTYVSYKDELLWSFPTTIVSSYDPSIGLKTMRNSFPNTWYEVKIDYQLEDFISYQAVDSFDCEKIANKIIVLGSIGPSNADSYEIPNYKEPLFGTVIIANIINSIIHSEFNEVKVDKDYGKGTLPNVEKSL